MLIKLHTLKARREDIVGLASHWGGRNVRVFGSFARGDANRQSDVDFPVEFAPNRNLLDHGRADNNKPR